MNFIKFDKKRIIVTFLATLGLCVQIILLYPYFVQKKISYVITDGVRDIINSGVRSKFYDLGKGNISKSRSYNTLVTLLKRKQIS